MKFSTLKEKCEYYRNLTNYKLTPNSYTIIMLDGHCFSKMIKNKFAKPFDDNFINAMNETAKYLVENIQGAKFAYVQSDEISILVTDFDTPETDSCFGYRICKMQSIFAAMAAAYFNRYMTIYSYSDGEKNGRLIYKELSHMSKMVNGKLIEFDRKIWKAHGSLPFDDNNTIKELIPKRNGDNNIKE